MMERTSIVAVLEAKEQKEGERAVTSRRAGFTKKTS